jgi:hypothetical protein
MNFGLIADKYPTEREALARLDELLAHLSPSDREFTLNRLCELLHPRSREALASVLGELVRQGVFKLVVRVVSPATQGGIKDYESLEAVPDSIHDWRSDREIEVTPELLRVVYVLAGPQQHGVLSVSGGR